MQLTPFIDTFDRPRPPGADVVYALTKRLIDDLARLTLELTQRRDPDREDARAKEAYDALEDVRQLSVELCVLWDGLWSSIGGGQPDPMRWSDPRYAQVDADAEDLWAERQVQAEAERQAALDAKAAADELVLELGRVED